MRMRESNMEERWRERVRDLEGSFTVSRFPEGLHVVLLILYTPLGLFLAFLRTCMSLQVLLLLYIFPEGMLKRFLLRLAFGVLGIIVTADLSNKECNTKLFVGNRLSHLDGLALHLALDCTTVSTGGKGGSLFNHQVLKSESDEDLSAEGKELPEFDENCSVADFTPYAIQPEVMPTNGTCILLPFRDWPFTLDSTVQPLVLTATRPFGTQITTVDSSMMWDLFWMVFSPITFFHVRVLPPVEKGAHQSRNDFKQEVQEKMAEELELKVAAVEPEEVCRWLKEMSTPPSPPLPARQPRAQHTGTAPLPPPAASDTGAAPAASSAREHVSADNKGVGAVTDLEAMVFQVLSVLPQVPHTIVRADLIRTGSVDVTVSNLLDGTVPYRPSSNTGMPAPNSSVERRPTNSGSSAAARTPPDSASAAARPSPGAAPAAKGMTPKRSWSSMQRHLVLEERKAALIEEARRRYIEKHGLSVP